MGSLCIIDVNARAMVMLEPFVIYVIVLGFSNSLKFILPNFERFRFRISTLACLAIASLLLLSWAKMQPWRDSCSVTGNKRLVTSARLASLLPENRIIMTEVDHFSIALMSGRATVTLPPWIMWNNGHGEKFLRAQGRCATIWKRREDASKALIDYLPSTGGEQPPWKDKVTSRIYEVNGLEFLLGSVGYDIDFSDLVARFEQTEVPARIHKRWFNVKPEDVPILYQEAYFSNDIE